LDLDENDCLYCDDEDDFVQYLSIVEREPRDFLQERKIYNSLSQLIAEIADCCDRGLERIEINEYGYISVYLDWEKCK
jgi:hypothetical protein